jgi:alpha-D-xyloside xylohydrolase
MMKKRGYAICMLMLLSVAVFAQSYQKTELGVKAQINSIDIAIQFYGPSIVRVVKSPEGNSFEKESLSVVKTPEDGPFTLKRTGEMLLLKNKSIEVALNLKNGTVSFRGAEGQILLTEKEGSATFTDFDDAGVTTYSVSQSYLLDQDEPIYGLGILQNGKMSQRNQEVHMVQNNTWDFVTFFQSVKGYGLFWDNYSPTTFKDTPGETSFGSEVGECIDYYFMYGGDADGVIAEMRDLTG